MVCLLVTSTASRDGLGADTNSGWGTATLIEFDNTGDADNPKVAVDDSGNAIAIWTQHDGIYFSLQSNIYTAGTGWGTAELIETRVGTVTEPRVAVDGSGNATAIWRQPDSSYNSIWSNRYVVGTGWGIATLIETDDSEHAYEPQVAVGRTGDAIAVWYQWEESVRTNVWANRYDVGTGWGTAELIENMDSENAYDPQVAVDSSGDATAVWIQWDGSLNNIWSNRYVVGTGWDSAVLIETDDAGHASNPQVAIDGSGNAIAVWQQDDGDRSNIWSNQYVVGTGWGTPTLIETNDAGSARNPQVAVDDSGNAMVVWEHFDGTRYDIWSNRYDVGTGWGTAVLIEAIDTGNAYDPQVAVDADSNAIAVWHQSDGVSFNVWSNRYVAGAGWDEAQIIETVAGDAGYSQVAVDGSGNAVAVWSQFDGVRYNIWSNRYVWPDTTPPPLSLDSPSDGLTTEAPLVMVAGTTEPGVDLSVNGMMVAVEPDGSFYCLIVLVEGVNTIVATATDASDNSATASVSVTYVNPVHEIEEELEDTKDELVDVRDELNTTQDDLDAIEEELDATKDELNATQDKLDAVEEELSATQDDLASTEEELTSTSDDLSAVKSQNTLLMMVLAAFAILAVVMTVMFMSVRKKLAELSGKSVEEETPPPPQS